MTLSPRNEVHLAVALTLLCVFGASGATVKVSGQGNPPPGGMPWLEYRLGRILSSLPDAGLDTLQDVYADGAALSVPAFFEKAPCEPARYAYDVRVIEVGASTWEARDIPVKLVTRGAKNELRSLVVTFDGDARIVDARFALEDHDYAEIMMRGDSLSDLTTRQKILSLMENYRTAYDTKNLEFITRILSDDALIIVGREISNADKIADRVSSPDLPQVKIEYLRKSKSEYLESLRAVFAANQSVHIDFDSITVTQHPLYPRIYGINLEQTWNSTKYSDHGYLFVLLNFRDEERPLLHVRSWQKEPFSDGSTVALGDFQIVPDTSSEK